MAQGQHCPDTFSSFRRLIHERELSFYLIFTENIIKVAVEEKSKVERTEAVAAIVGKSGRAPSVFFDHPLVRWDADHELDKIDLALKNIPLLTVQMFLTSFVDRMSLKGNKAV